MWKRCLFTIACLYTFVGFFCIDQVSAKSIEIPKMEMLLAHVDERTLVIFDIDNTILEMAQALGSDQWFYHNLEKHRLQGLSSQDALEQLLPIYHTVQNISEVRPVEECTPGIIKDLQKKSLTVMALTTRGRETSGATHRQLHSLGIDMELTAPSTRKVSYEIDRKPVEYTDGVLFTSGSHKGKALWRLFALLDYYPTKVVFINDKDSHLAPVEETLQEKGIPFIGLRYSASDAKVLNFRPELGDIQLRLLHKILSDSEAEALLKTTP